MYLARRRIRHKTIYSIRHSYAADGGYKSRELFDLGTDPERFIIYPGGNSYYYDPSIEDTLAEKGIDADQTALDEIFFEFLTPRIQRVISGFDRAHHRRTKNNADTETNPQPVHIFDKRRYHYLRFGYSEQEHISRVGSRVFNLLQHKSRDELEHYFWGQERRLPLNEKAVYVAIIFSLHKWSPDITSDRNSVDQLDDFFTLQLCRLNSDRAFLSGVPQFSGLSAYLIRYAIFYFDYAPPRRSPEQDYIHEFINRHRVHRPPASIQVKMDEAEKLFGHAWEALRKMNRAQLTRAYRRRALKSHPDTGGDPEVFRRLTQYYQALLNRKPR